MGAANPGKIGLLGIKSTQAQCVCAGLPTPRGEEGTEWGLGPLPCSWASVISLEGRVSCSFCKSARGDRDCFCRLWDSHHLGLINPHVLRREELTQKNTMPSKRGQQPERKSKIHSQQDEAVRGVSEWGRDRDMSFHDKIATAGGWKEREKKKKFQKSKGGKWKVK